MESNGINNFYKQMKAKRIQGRRECKQKSCNAGSVSISQFLLKTLFTVTKNSDIKSTSAAKLTEDKTEL